MPRKSIFDMSFSAVYAALVNKVEKKGRTKTDVKGDSNFVKSYGIGSGRLKRMEE